MQGSHKPEGGGRDMEQIATLSGNLSTLMCVVKNEPVLYRNEPFTKATSPCMAYITVFVWSSGVFPIVHCEVCVLAF